MLAIARTQAFSGSFPKRNGFCSTTTLLSAYRRSGSTWWERPYGTTGLGMETRVVEPPATVLGMEAPIVEPPTGELRRMEDGPFRRDITRGRFPDLYRMDDRDMSIRRDAIMRGRGRFDSMGAPMTPTIQGGSLRTYSKGYGSPYDDKSLVEFSTDGRPLHGNFRVWDGPDNTPAIVNVYSQDGYYYGVRMVTGRRNGAYHGGSESYQLRNNGPLEFPMRADIRRVRYEYDPPRSPALEQAGVEEMASTSRPGRRSIRYRNDAVGTSFKGQTIQGGSNKCWTIAPRVESVKVELHSQGLPIMARVELLQGPNNVKTLAEIYQQDGYQRPFVAVLDTPGYHKGSVRIVNDGPMEFPISASVEPYEVY